MARGPQRPKRILVVEDDAWIRTFIRDVLTDEGYDVVEAADGRTSLRLAAARPPDLVLLDLAMPELTGVDVLHELKRARGTQPVPVLVLSAYTRVLPACDANSVAAVLSKPLDVERLLESVREAIAASGAESMSNAHAGQLGTPVCDQEGQS